jgi:hypothetical protein
MIYSIPYLALLSFYFFLALIEYQERRNPIIRQWAIVICLITFVLFFGLRGFIGWDWTAYYRHYESTPNLFDFVSESKSNRLELGFNIYMSFFKTLFFNYHAFVFVSTILHICLLNVFLKRYLPPGYFIFGFIVFLVMGGFGMEVDTMRNIISILLFLISLKYIEERKIIKFYALNILGILFHLSAIFYLPLYFFLHKKIERWLIFFIFLVGTILFLFQIEYVRSIVLGISKILGGKYQRMTAIYLENSVYGKSYGLSIGSLERLFSAILVFAYYPKLIKASKHNIIFINAFVLYFFIFFYFSEIAIISIRGGMLFVFAYWVLWPSIVNISKIEINRYVFICVMFIYIVFKMVGMTRFQLYQYDNLILGIQTYEERKWVFDRIAQAILENRL